MYDVRCTKYEVLYEVLKYEVRNTKYLRAKSEM